jgi:anaerobic ribonucleoside-triphosphate reductase
MFQCDHCKREYGGIRGVTGQTCPRCLSNRESIRSEMVDRKAQRSYAMPGPLLRVVAGAR